MSSSLLDRKLQGFQLLAQEKLQAILCSVPGRKDLIIEPSLIKPLEHICAASWLKLKGVQRIFKLDPQNAIIRSAADQVQLYMIRSDLETFCKVLDQVKLIRKSEANSNTWANDGSLKLFHVLCIPSCFAYFQLLLEHEGLFGIVQLHRYCWDFIYLDEGVLSMEVPNVLSTAFMRSDCSLIPAISSSIRVLHILCGRPEFILTYGEHAENIVKMLNQLGPLPKTLEGGCASDFGAMLIVDRDKDFASPLLTPAIYSGLLLEVFNFSGGNLTLDPKNRIDEQKLSIFEVKPKKDKATSTSKTADQKTAKPVGIRLSGSHDAIYAGNRYRHFAAASSRIRQQAKSISAELQKLNNMKINEMHDYVNRQLPKITEMKNQLLRHLHASEKVIEKLGSKFKRVQTLEEDILNNVSRKKILGDIEELLAVDGHRYNTLRLLCLLHLCAGITSAELTQFIRNYCNYFGHKYLPIFEQLSHVGLLPRVSDEDSTPLISTPLNKTATKLLSTIPLSMPKFQQTAFQANANRLKLMVSSAGAEDIDNASIASLSSSSASSVSTDSSPAQCPSYVFNRLYIPLVAQLSSFLLKSSSSEDFVQKFAMIEQIQINGQSLKQFVQGIKQGDLKDPLPLVNRNVLVHVVGGITYAEIAACNLISKLTESQVFVTSDRILSGADVIAAAF